MHVLPRNVPQSFRRKHDFWCLHSRHEARRRRPQCHAILLDELRDERMDDQQGGLEVSEGAFQLPHLHDTALLLCRHIQKAQSDSTDAPSRPNHVLPDVSQLEAYEDASLQHLQHLCAKDGPSLSLDWKLRRLSQLQRFLPLLPLLGGKSIRLCHHIDFPTNHCFFVLARRPSLRMAHDHIRLFQP